MSVVANADALLAIEAVAHRLGVPCDAIDTAAALGSSDLSVLGDSEVAGLASALDALGVESRWVEQDPSALRSPWIARAPRNASADVLADGLIVGLGRAGLRHDVVICRDGVAIRRRVWGPQLRTLLGIPAGTEVRALITSIGAPLAALHDPTHSMSPWRRVRRLAHLERSDIWVTVVYGIAIGVLSLVLPVAAQALVTAVAFGSVLQPLVVLTILFALAAVAAGVLHLLQAWVVEIVQQRVFGRALVDVARRLVSTPHNVGDRLHVPDLINRFFEVPTIQKSLAAILVGGVGLVLQTLLGLTLLAFYHPLLLAFSLLLVALLAFVIFWIGRGAVGSALDESRAKYQAVGWLEHLARIPMAFKSTSGRQLALTRADRFVRRYLDARRRHFRKLLMQTGGGIALAVVGPTALLGLGGLLVLRNQLTLGQLVAAELVMASLSAALVKLGKQLESVYDLVQGTTKLGMLVDLPAERRGGERSHAAKHADRPASLRAHDLSLVVANKSVLQRVALDVPAGAKVAVCGPGGAGKSMLLDVLASLRSPTGGNVELDGCDLRLLDLASVREEVLLVRGADFVDGSILDNLRLLRQQAPLEEVAAAVADVHLTEVVRALPDGLGTAMQPSGAPLSASQGRRLALARALVASPRLLVLDETLDVLGVDRAAKLAILDRVLARDAPWTVVVATSDADVIARCSDVLTLGPATSGGST
jgi:ABC-type bacteriocin/lantibiotic exporter with double-glycine peptidase domain